MFNVERHPSAIRAFPETFLSSDNEVCILSPSFNFKYSFKLFLNTSSHTFLS